MFGTLVLAQAAYAQSADASDHIKKRIDEITKKDFGCTRSRKEIRRMRKQFPAYHFAFAGRKALTITGIRGCGIAWNTSRQNAQADAMRRCKKWEQTYGTQGGRNLCRLLN